eukprot:11628737-Karenia_brevis.AAC.1
MACEPLARGQDRTAWMEDEDEMSASGSIAFVSAVAPPHVVQCTGTGHGLHVGLCLHMPQGPLPHFMEVVMPNE